MLKIAFFASGSGTNIGAVLDRIDGGDLPAEPVFILSNNSRSGALERARKAEIPAYHVSKLTEGDENQVTDKLIGLLKSHQVDLLVLAGYMKKVPLELIRFMAGKLINIHPALLPAFGGAGFYGDRIHQAVLKRGCQYTGITVHAVTEEYDEGPIILQRAVRVLPGSTLDTVKNSVMQVEYDSLWRVIKGYADGTLYSDSGKLMGIAGFQKSFLQNNPSSDSSVNAASS